MALVGVNKVAKALNVEARTVQRLVNEGMPKAAHGKYDLGACLLWYVRYLQAALERALGHRGNGEDSLGKKLREERTGLIKAQREREELELAARREELIPVAIYEQEVATLFTVLQRRLLTMPARLAPHLEGENRTTIKARLDQAVRGDLTALATELANGNGHADTGSVSGSPGHGSSGATATRAAAEPEGERVGRAAQNPA